MSAADRAALELRDITVRAGGHTLLDAVSFEVRPGSIVGLIGPNGAGKTTLVRVALGLLRPDRGEVRWFGHAPREARARGVRVGYVPQRGNWDPRFPLSVEETVLLVSHDVGMIASLADEVACLNQRLHFHGAPREVLDQHSLAAAYGCEVELVTHGHVPHRVLRHHGDEGP